MSFVPPEGTLDPYPRKKPGYSGEFGDGANIRIRFLQTAISREELDSIDLIENIPGSERWDVRDLFQRTVDKERVGHSILPYLQDKDKVKFFNPLTLILLPFDTDTAQIEKELFYVEPREEELSGHAYEVLEKEGCYRFLSHSVQPAYSYVEWNEQRVKVVAIDGQHRLSALKRWKDDPTRGGELSGWRIPVVLLGMFKADKEVSTPNILEVVRKTFIYINSTAKEINESRRILLDDESVNCICSQEVVQVAHENDQKGIYKLDGSKVPLMFYDWRGEVLNERPHPGPAAIKNVEELKEWFSNYILGDDGGDDQRSRLNVDDMLPPLSSFAEDKKLTHEDAELIRKQFKKHLLPAFNYVMENFSPYKNYIAECRTKQYHAEQGDDLAKHAFQKICFGTHRAGQELIEAVDGRYHEIVDEFTELKQNSFQELIARDIGMRGIWSAFDILKNIADQIEEETSDWLGYSEWFTDKINNAYKEGWFKAYDNLLAKHRALLTHIVYDQAGSIINYKFKDVPDAFGSLLCVLVVRDESNEYKDAVWNELAANLKKPLRKGFRRQVRAELRDTFAGTTQAFDAEVNTKADKEVEKRLRQIKKLIESD